MSTIGAPPAVEVHEDRRKFHIKWKYETEELTPDDFRILIKYNNGVILEAYPRAEGDHGEYKFTVPDKICPDEIAPLEDRSTLALGSLAQGLI